MKAIFVSSKCFTALTVLLVSALAAIMAQSALAHGTSASSSATSTVANTSNPPGIMSVPGSSGPSPTLICPLAVTPVKATMADGTSVPAIEGPSPLATGCYYPTVVVSCNPTTIVVGGSSTCSWSITGADPGVPCFKSGGWAGDVSPNSSGSQTISFSTTGTTSFYVNCPDDPQAGVGGASVTVNPSSGGGGGGGGCTTGCGGTGSSPSGYLDVIDVNGVAAGWTCDADSYGTPLTVEFHLDGTGGPNLGTMTANQTRSDVGGVCGGTTNHGYWFSLPASVKDGKVHTLYVLAYNVGGGGNAWLVHSGMQFVLSPPPVPAPTVSSFTSSNSYPWSGNGVTISWNCPNATTVSVKSPTGGGFVSSSLASSSWGTPALPAGEQEYDLTCLNSSGTVTATLYVDVFNSQEQENGVNDQAGQSVDPDNFDSVLHCRWKSQQNQNAAHNFIGTLGGAGIKVDWCVDHGYIRKVVRSYWTIGCSYVACNWANKGFSSPGSCNTLNCSDYVSQYGTNRTSINIWMQVHLQLCSVKVWKLPAVCIRDHYVTVGVLIRGDGTRANTYAP
jgi:hypothetical protein